MILLYVNGVFETYWNSEWPDIVTRLQYLRPKCLFVRARGWTIVTDQAYR